MPVVVPETLIGLAAPVPVLVTPPLLEVQVAALLVTGLPFAAPAVNETFIGTTGEVEPDAALTFVGAAGLSAGAMAFEGPDAGPVPTPLVAVTAHVYVLPRVRPFTTIALTAPLADPVTPPLVEVQVAVKLVIGRPLLVPGVNGTRNPEPDRVTVPTVGALGTVAGMIAFESAELEPVPIELVALTRQV